MSETSVLKDFLDEFSYLNWVRNVDNSTYEAYVYDPYGNTFLVSLDLPNIYNNDINSFSPNEKVPILLDCASNISKVIVIESTDKLQTNMNTSNHDFDLAMTLKLLLKLHKIEGFKAICIPQTLSEQDLLDSKSIIAQL